MITYHNDIEYYDSTSMVAYSVGMNNGFSIDSTPTKCNLPQKYSTEYAKPYSGEDHIIIFHKPKPHHAKKRKGYEY